MEREVAKYVRGYSLFAKGADTYIVHCHWLQGEYVAIKDGTSLVSSCSHKSEGDIVTKIHP